MSDDLLLDIMIYQYCYQSLNWVNSAKTIIFMTDSQLLSQKKGTFCLDIDVKKSGFDIAGNNVMGACRRVYACLSCIIMHTI